MDLHSPYTISLKKDSKKSIINNSINKFRLSLIRNLRSIFISPIIALTFVLKCLEDARAWLIEHSKSASAPCILDFSTETENIWSSHSFVLGADKSIYLVDGVVAVGTADYKRFVGYDVAVEGMWT